MKIRNHSDHNNMAFTSGLMAGAESNDRDGAFPAYRAAVSIGAFMPSVSASVCFVAGFLGNSFPGHDERVTS